MKNYANFILDATQLGIDVQDKLFKAISFLAPDPNDMQIFYNNIKNSVKNSEKKLVTSKGISVYSLKDIYEQKVFFKNDYASDLDYVGFKTKIHDALFFEIRDEKHKFFEIDNSFNLFLNIINFFIDIDQEKIGEFIFAFDHKMEMIRDSNSEYEEDLELEKDIENNNIKNIPEKIQENSYQTIKSQLEQKYSYDENGELSPIEEVLSDLSQMAEEKADENIEELYIFDENMGKFVWNEDLLNQN